MKVSKLALIAKLLYLSIFLAFGITVFGRYGNVQSTDGYE